MELIGFKFFYKLVYFKTKFKTLLSNSNLALTFKI